MALGMRRERTDILDAVDMFMRNRLAYQDQQLREKEIANLKEYRDVEQKQREDLANLQVLSGLLADSRNKYHQLSLQGAQLGLSPVDVKSDEARKTLEQGKVSIETLLDVTKNQIQSYDAAIDALTGRVANRQQLLTSIPGIFEAYKGIYKGGKPYQIEKQELESIREKYNFTPEDYAIVASRIAELNKEALESEFKQRLVDARIYNLVTGSMLNVVGMGELGNEAENAQIRSMRDSIRASIQNYNNDKLHQF